MERGRAVFSAAMMVCGLTSTALAGPDVYCDAYAREFANRKAGIGADTLAGTIGGAIGGVVDKGASAGKGAVIGGVSGVVISAASTDEKWRTSYDKAFAGCMDNYEPRETEAVDAPAPTPAPAPAPAPAKKAEKPKPGTKEWVAYCAARYRSFDADTGRYKSYSGEMRVCR